MKTFLVNDWFTKLLSGVALFTLLDLKKDDRISVFLTGQTPFEAHFNLMILVLLFTPLCPILLLLWGSLVFFIKDKASFIIIFITPSYIQSSMDIKVIRLFKVFLFSIAFSLVFSLSLLLIDTLFHSFGVAIRSFFANWGYGLIFSIGYIPYFYAFMMIQNKLNAKLNINKRAPLHQEFLKAFTFALTFASLYIFVILVSDFFSKHPLPP